MGILAWLDTYIYKILPAVGLEIAGTGGGGQYTGYHLIVPAVYLYLIYLLCTALFCGILHD